MAAGDGDQLRIRGLRTVPGLGGDPLQPDIVATTHQPLLCALATLRPELITLHFAPSTRPAAGERLAVLPVLVCRGNPANRHRTGSRKGCDSPVYLVRLGKNLATQQR